MSYFKYSFTLFIYLIFAPYTVYGINSVVDFAKQILISEAKSSYSAIVPAILFILAAGMFVFAINIAYSNALEYAKGPKFEKIYNELSSDSKISSNTGIAIISILLLSIAILFNFSFYINLLKDPFHGTTIFLILNFIQLLYIARR